MSGYMVINWYTDMYAYTAQDYPIIIMDFTFDGSTTGSGDASNYI